MTDSGVTQVSHSPIEAVLADDLARGDVVLGTIGPMMGILLASHDHALFSDEIVARVRSMVASIARQLLVAEAAAAGEEDAYAFAAERGDALAGAMAESLPLLGHCHALALEHRLATDLERRTSIDPVLSPLLQSLIASSDAETARVAMALLAAQARFVQRQRRMELTLEELPHELFDFAVDCWRTHSGGDTNNAVAQAEQRVRDAYDTHERRASLLERAAGATGDAMQPAMSLAHAGVALFLTAIALIGKQDRDLVAVSTNESQLGRLSLAMRAAGLKPADIAEQFALIHPHTSLPDTFDTLRSDRAGEILAASGRKALG
ncbi:hypothetical protein [Pelagerythrobacter sp.]|uniref:hypothetical protein n=1 Tax=Pelagerythrobacter sp. TaxID=2800702 RepID=UPI0035AF052A